MIAYMFQKYLENFAFQLSSLAYFLVVSMNTKISVFVICVEAIIYLLLHNLHDCTFKHFWCQVLAILYSQQPLFLCLTKLLTLTVSVIASVTVIITVSVTVLNKKELDYSLIFSICYFSYVYSQHKAVLISLIMPMIPFRGCM